MERKLFYLLMLSWCDLSDGAGIDVGLCDSTLINCQCGSPGYTFPTEVKQCTYFYRWKPTCKPCGKVSADTLCPRYSNCLECTTGEEKCVACPPGKYGNWCTGTCQCENGALCSRDGSCRCRPGFEGNYCEIVKEKPVTCSDPGIPKDSERIPSSGTFDNIEVGSTFHFKCAEGTIRIGPASITCTSAGIWSDNKPFCSKECPAPTKLSNGEVSLKNTVFGKTVDGTTASFSCDPSFSLNGESILTCQNEGKWNHEPPTCQKIEASIGTEVWHLDIHIPRLEAINSGRTISRMIDRLRSLYATIGFVNRGTAPRQCLQVDDDDDSLPIDWRTRALNSGVISPS